MDMKSSEMRMKLFKIEKMEIKMLSVINNIPDYFND